MDISFVLSFVLIRSLLRTYVFPFYFQFLPDLDSLEYYTLLHLRRGRLICMGGTESVPEHLLPYFL
jgi:hypothetical protein